MASDQYLKNMSKIGVSDTAWVANTDKGGQLGLGLNAPNLDASSPIVLPPVTPIVIHLPTMYDDNPAAQFYLKNIVESHSKSISGIGLNYTMEFDDVIVGHDGQSISVPKKSKRSPVSPSITYQELLGNPIWELHRKWITDYSDPDTNFSYIGMDDELTIVPSIYSMAILFIQFDLTGRPDNIINAYIVSNMFPEETGELGSEKNIGESKTMERSINYRGLLHHTRPILDMAKEIATEMSLHTIKYYETAKSINHGVEGYIPTNFKDSGIAKEIKDYIGE